MDVNLQEILRDNEIRDVRKQLAKLATRARRRRQGAPLTEQQKADLVAEKISGHQWKGAAHEQSD